MILIYALFGRVGDASSVKDVLSSCHGLRATPLCLF